jgi:hypothetical protein
MFNFILEKNYVPRLLINYQESNDYQTFKSSFGTINLIVLLKNVTFAVGLLLTVSVRVNPVQISRHSCVYSFYDSN